MIEMYLLGILLLLVGGYLLYHFRGRPKPSDISSLAELKERLATTRFTIVQFYAPL
jgi:hypothetical protein